MRIIFKIDKESTYVQNGFTYIPRIGDGIIAPRSWYTETIALDKPIQELKRVHDVICNPEEETINVILYE